MKVFKTVKLYIGGKFPRTESGRSYPQKFHNRSKVYAHLCQSSRKDLRITVEAARKAQPGWEARSAYNRGQILYRMAEMLEGKRPEFEQLFNDTLGYTKAKSNKAIDEAIDAFVYYAGFSDKYQQISSTVNPTNTPHHNFTMSEAVGVTTLVCADKFDFGKIVADISGLICGGNSVVVLLGNECPAVLAPLAEVLATSDLPGGVINLLTGDLKEIYKHMASHMEIHSINYQNENKAYFTEMKEMAIDNMKRLHPRTDGSLCVEKVLSFLEYKTVWHPVGF